MVHIVECGGSQKELHGSSDRKLKIDVKSMVPEHDMS